MPGSARDIQDHRVSKSTWIIGLAATEDLPTNQEVGGSNSSGRAIFHWFRTRASSALPWASGADARPLIGATVAGARRRIVRPRRGTPWFPGHECRADTACAIGGSLSRWQQPGGGRYRCRQHVRQLRTRRRRRVGNDTPEDGGVGRFAALPAQLRRSDRGRREIARRLTVSDGGRVRWRTRRPSTFAPRICADAASVEVRVLIENGQVRKDCRNQATRCRRRLSPQQRPLLLWMIANARSHAATSTGYASARGRRLSS